MTADLPPSLSVDVLVSGAADAADLTPDQARAFLTAAFGLLDRHAEVGARDALFAAVTGAEALARSPEAKAGRPTGLFGGLMKSAGGLSGAAIADAMGRMQALKSAGVDRDRLKRLASATRAQIRSAAGRDLLGDAIRTIPGISALLGGSGSGSSRPSA